MFDGRVYSRVYKEVVVGILKGEREGLYLGFFFVWIRIRGVKYIYGFVRCFF